MSTEELIRELPKGILKWYRFKENSKVLYLTDRNDLLKIMFAEQGIETVCIKSFEVPQLLLDRYRESFDYIVAIGIIERCADPQKDISLWKTLLKKDGVLLIGADNRLGLRYFCGDRDEYTGRSFDSIENYRRISMQDRNRLKGRTYAKYEIKELLSDSGINEYKFYTVLPTLDFPQLIYADDYEPVEELATRYIPMYYNPDTIFLEEEHLYGDLIKNGVFHAFANAYLIECPMNGQYTPIQHVTVSMDRGHDNALFTIIRKDGRVEKKAAYPEGQAKMEQMMEYSADLQAHGLNVVDSAIENGVLVMPYVDAEIVTAYFARLIKKDKNQFIEAMDSFRNLILQSSEHVLEDQGDGIGILLKRGYLDLVPLNCFMDNGKYVFYDQEFCEENYPANAIIYRSLNIAYSADREMQRIIPMEFFIKRYGLEEKRDLWNTKTGEFLNKLHHLRELGVFNERYKRNIEVLNTNRQRMNYSASEYQRLFVDVFKGVENKRLIIFGSGTFAKKFIELYGQDYTIDAIVDNDEQKWGQSFEGINILSPDELVKMDTNTYKVIICIKNYITVIKQLRNMGVKHFSIYDTNMDYPKKHVGQTTEKTEVLPKRYHVGYVAGVFDLFHVGHLNILRRAKEQCDYLIAGVVMDDAVHRNKKTETFIPFEERIEIVRACRYVDEAVGIPSNYGSTRDVYHLYHFDCQFSGSDYINNPDWLAAKEFLEKQGSDMVFFPYTASTSSTKIKAMIDKELMS